MGLLGYTHLADEDDGPSYGKSRHLETTAEQSGGRRTFAVKSVDWKVPPGRLELPAQGLGIGTLVVVCSWVERFDVG
jgi:hypothetical protein